MRGSDVQQRVLCNTSVSWLYRTVYQNELQAYHRSKPESVGLVMNY